MEAMRMFFRSAPLEVFLDISARDIGDSDGKERDVEPNGKEQHLNQNGAQIGFRRFLQSQPRRSQFLFTQNTAFLNFLLRIEPTVAGGDKGINKPQQRKDESQIGKVGSQGSREFLIVVAGFPNFFPILQTIRLSLMHPSRDKVHQGSCSQHVVPNGRKHQLRSNRFSIRNHIWLVFRHAFGLDSGRRRGGGFRIAIVRSRRNVKGRVDQLRGFFDHAFVALLVRAASAALHSG
mmetsp:Transcript_13794/g.28489  ORF Transcript_13794/g.28489 Transcript_13794/m.28489 type:complete len:234 (-) Transcript_13794:89-790(-)